MSRLDELIKKLCPDGVEYMKIGELASYEQPSKYIVNSTDYDESFDIPVLTAGQSFILGYTNETQGIYEASQDNPVIIFDDFTGAFKWVDFPFKVKSSAMKMITANTEITILRYLFHIMGKLGFSSSEHKRLWIRLYSEFRVPVPPLEIQHEIVRILDNFTELTAELTAELTFELTARKRQFDYYRNTLMSMDPEALPFISGLLKEYCPNGVEYKSIDNISKSISSGGTPKSSVQKYYGGDIPWVRTQEVDWKDIKDTKMHITQEGLESSSAKWIPANCLIIAMYGATAAKVAINKIPVTTNQACCNIEPDTSVVSLKYLYHYMASQYEELKAMGRGSQSNINAQIIKNYTIPVPPTALQVAIEKILDCLDIICNEIIAGLHSEIEARQKQYEYYRDKLLSFKEKES